MKSSRGVTSRGKMSLKGIEKHLVVLDILEEIEDKKDEKNNYSKWDLSNIMPSFILCSYLTGK